MTEILGTTITELLDAGVHFGHKKDRWDPKMAPYIYGVKNNVHIIDLRQTVGLVRIALNVIYETAKRNGRILFVGTKVQARDIVAQCAEKCGQYYVNHRWLGGMLTNWKTISRSIKKIDQFEKTLTDEEKADTYTKKEILDISRKRDKVMKSLGGIKNIGDKLPNLIVIFDTNKEHLAIQEALKLGIPIVAIVDSNSNPDNIDYPIPGNDDAIRSISLYGELFARAALSGIEASLSASGVDIGAMTNPDDQGRDKDLSGVSRLKPTKKVSKATDINSNLSSEITTKFEEGLQTENLGDKAKKSINKKEII